VRRKLGEGNEHVTRSSRGAKIRSPLDRPPAKKVLKLEFRLQKKTSNTSVDHHCHEIRQELSILLTSIFEYPLKIGRKRFENY
jgi:hypothetical protein